MMMIKTLGIIFIACVIYLVEYRFLKNKAAAKDRVIFFALLLIGVFLSILEVADMEISSPLYLIEVIYKPVYTFVINLLS